MPSPASVVYLLGSVAKEKTEGTYAKRLRYLKEWKIKQNDKEKSSKITNSPQDWDTPSLRGRTKENLTHFFKHYRLTLTG